MIFQLWLVKVEDQEVYFTCFYENNCDNHYEDYTYVDDFSIVKEEYTENLIGCLEDIFNPSIPFFQTEILKTCEYCDYRAICNR